MMQVFPARDGVLALSIVVIAEALFVGEIGFDTIATGVFAKHL